MKVLFSLRWQQFRILPPHYKLAALGVVFSLDQVAGFPVLIYHNQSIIKPFFSQLERIRLPWGLPGILSWSTTWPSAVAILDWLQVSFSPLPSPSRDIRYYETKVQNVVISILLRVFSNENIIFGLKQCCQDFCLH